ncbi:MAG: ribosome-associated translation inhibitor RaiA [Pseudomonadota bacterium]|nr:MAG: ribosome-associated translation inhibitor RaiA [Pseudomonadota bacterium]
MYLYVTARQFELTEGLRNYVEQRLVRSARNHANPHDLQRMEVQLYKVGEGEPRFGCHVLLHMPGQKDINIREEALDLYEAIDGADKRLVRTLVDRRERRLTNARHPKKFSWDRLGRALGWVRR